MGKRRKKPIVHKKKREQPRIWCREAIDAYRLSHPDETQAQVCWCCGIESIRLTEIHDAYGRLVLCRPCLMNHTQALLSERKEAKPEKKIRRLPTYAEWLAEATIEEMESVLERHKRRTGRG